MALKLRALDSLAEDPDSLLAPRGGSQPSITTVSGVPNPSSDFQGPLCVHANTHSGACTHTHTLFFKAKI